MLEKNVGYNKRYCDEKERKKELYEKKMYIFLIKIYISLHFIIIFSFHFTKIIIGIFIKLYINISLALL